MKIIRLNTSSLPASASTSSVPKINAVALAIASALGMTTHPLYAATCTASDDATLQACISGAASGDVINITSDITLSSYLPQIATNLTVSGNNHTISGNNTYRVFWVESGTVSLQKLTIANGKAQGGNGGSPAAGGGGGGGGLGGGLFVNGGAVTLQRVNFSGNAAKGGNGSAPGGSLGGGGGGGMGGNGGGGVIAGGGGGLNPGQNGGTQTPGGSGGAGGPQGASGSPGGFGGGGGGSGSRSSGSGGGLGGFGGGGGGSGYYGGSGGIGGFGGGGGGGGGGGFGGGGGGGLNPGQNGGTGGWGGGVGGNSGVKLNGGGGGGLGAGGAVFAKSGTLTFSRVAFTNSSASAGTGIGSGQAKGGAVFICTAVENASCSATVSSACGVTFTGSSAANAGTTDTNNVDNYNGSKAALTASVCNDEPVATVNAISGTTNVGDSLTGTYSYSDTENNPEDTAASSYRWVRADNVGMTTNPSSVATGTTGGAPGTKTYTIVAADIGKYLFYCVTPQATTGTLVGIEACSTGAQIPNSPPPTAPTGLTGTVVSSTQVDLSWTDNSSNETGFKVFKDGTLVTTTAANATSYSVTGLTCNTAYTFTVKATNANGDSSAEATSPATTTTSACNVAPVATVNAITGTTNIGGTLTSSYSYSDSESDLEYAAASNYRWVRADNVGMTTNPTDIATGTTGGAPGTKTYTIVPVDRSKYLFYCVTPKATAGTLTGTEACSTGTQIPNNAITLTVTTNADPGTVGGCVSTPATNCSLRDAINTTSSTVVDTINFNLAAGLKTITLANELGITKSLIIDGTTQAVTVSGNSAVRVFNVGNGVNFTLQNLTVANGHSDSGGGFYISDGTVVVNNVAFIRNSAHYGGGAFQEAGTVEVNNVAFIGNSATSVGGAFLSDNGVTTVTNTTFSGNSSSNVGGGLVVVDGTVNLNGTTFVNNSATIGGGVYSYGGGTFNLKNTLLTNNTAVIGANCNGSGVVNGGNNIDDGTSCGFTTANNSLSSTNPLLGTLGNYGGLTQTFPLLPGSPAINAGSGCPANDQRGITRPQGTACDIGAFESQGFTFTKTGDNQSTLINTAFANPLKVDVASAGSEPVDGGQVTFAAPGSGASVTLTGSPATITSGAASVNATANSITGNYAITASAKGASDASFSLSNYNVPSVYSIAPSGSPATNATSFDFIVTFSEAVNGVDASDFTLTQTGTATGTIGTPTSTNNTDWTVPITNVSGTGTLRLDLKTTGTGITATATGAAIIGGFTNGTTHNVDTDAPSLPSVTGPNNGYYKAGQNLDFIVTYGESVTVTGTPRIPLTIGSSTVYANYFSGSPGTALTFRYTVQAGNTDNDGITAISPIELNGGTIRDIASNNANLTFTPPTLTGVIVDTTVPDKDATTPIVANDADNSGTYTQGDTLTLKFTEPVDINQVSVTNSHNFGTGYSKNPSSGYATSFVLTLGSNPTLLPADGIDLAATDQAGNTTVPIRFTIPELCTGNSLVVASTNDSGAGSLRQAIINTCPGGTITFANDLAVQLTTDQLAITKNLSIDGVGHTVSINGPGANCVTCFRVLNVSNGVNFTLKNLTVANGHSNRGGGFYISDGTVVVNNVAFIGNSADYGGGAFQADGTVAVNNVAFIGNSATLVGGAFLSDYGVTTVTNTTFSGNSSSLVGGAFLSDYGVTTVTNTTFSGNSASDKGGGLVIASGTVNLNGTTFVNNSATSGGGVYSYGGGTFNLKNTLLTNNTAGTGANCMGTITNGGNNLDSGTSCGFGSDNNSLSSTNPLLGALGNYGGLTQTFPLLPGSPAINAGSGCPANDQRGITRPQGTACDIGAFESQGFTFTKTGDNQSALINAAFSNPLGVNVTSTNSDPVNGGQITFTAPGSGASATLTGSPATITNGAASVNATANSITGNYTITASAKGASDASFSLTNYTYSPSPAPVNGVCGSANAQILIATPDVNLCNTGNPSAVNGNGPWSWSCSGYYGGNSVDCSAQLAAQLASYTVIANAGVGGIINPLSQPVSYNQKATFILTPNSGYAIESASGCSGMLNGNSYTTGLITAACTVNANFRAVRIAPRVNLSANPMAPVVNQPVKLTATVAASIDITTIPSRDVVISSDNSRNCYAPLNAMGTGSCSLTFPTAGSVTLTGTYRGDALFNPAKGNLTLTIGKAATTTALSSTRNPSTPGQPVTLMATVTSPDMGRPSGTVAFKEGTTALSGCESRPLSRAATCTPTGTLIAGTHTLTAQYSGNSDFSGSSGSVTQTVVVLMPTLTLTANSSTPLVGVATSITATVAAPSGTTGTPKGYVIISGGGQSCTVKLNAAGGGSCSLTYTTAGSVTLTGTYSGDALFNPAKGNLTLTIRKAATTTALSSTRNPSTPGQPVTLMATVTSPDMRIPSVTVAFKEGATALSGCASKPLLISGGSGAAICTTGTLTVGTHALTAQYSGDGGFSGSSGSVTQTVGLTPAVTLTANASTSVVGIATSITVTVTAPSGTTGTPKGDVTISGGGQSCTVKLIEAGGGGSCSLTYTTAGSVTLTGTYSGDALFNPAKGNLTLTIRKAATTTALSSTPNPSVLGQPVILTATVSGSSGSTTPDEGTVAFYQKEIHNTVTGCDAVPLLHGLATCLTETLKAGANTLDAQYAGTANWRTSSDGIPYSHTVDPADEPVVTTRALPNGVVGSPYALSLSARGGQPSYTYAATGDLPPGLTWRTQGVLAGTPTRAGTYSLDLTVTDTDKQPGPTQTYALSIAPALAVVTPTLADGITGVSYQQTLHAVGGQPPYTWKLDGGALPLGVMLEEATGILRGMPTKVETKVFVVGVSDSGHSPLTATQTLALTVRPLKFVRWDPITASRLYLALTLNPDAGSGCTLTTDKTKALALGEDGLPSIGPTDVTFRYGLLEWNVAGCTIGATTVTVTQVYPQDLLPGAQVWTYGSTLHNLSDHWYRLPGAQSQGNTVTYTLRDGGVGDDDLSRSLTGIAGPGVSHLGIGGTLPATGRVGILYTGALTAAPGVGPYVGSVADGSLPPGLILSCSTDTAKTCKLSGTPTEVGMFAFTLQIMDLGSNDLGSAGAIAQKAYAISVTQ